MPDRLRGIPGLPGLYEVDEDTRRKFLLDNEEKLRKYEGYPEEYKQAAEVMYNNQKFKDTFGEDVFKQYSNGTVEAYELRNKMLHDKLVSDAAKEKFQNDGDFDILAAQLDIQGWEDLLNSDYVGTQERQRRLQSGQEVSKRVAENYDTAMHNPYVDVLGAGYMSFGKATAVSVPGIKDRDLAEKDEEIRNKLFAETQERREAEVAEQADAIYNKMLSDDSTGKKSLAQNYEEFNQLATKSSPHYDAFKDSKWLKGYTDEDKLKEYAKYQALNSRYGEWVANQYLDRNIQNKVAEAQDGKWTGNTLWGLATTAASDLGSNFAIMMHLKDYLTPGRIGIINQGKDPDNYDEDSGDYKDDKKWYSNPAYWNDVYKYNTFSPTEIKSIKERGGVSKNVNIKPYGYTPEFFSAETFQEGFKQLGHIPSGIIETGITGGFGKATGLTLKTAMKATGASISAINKATKAGKVANDILVTLSTGLEGAQLEAMGTFEEQLQQHRQEVQDQIRHELHDYYQTIDYNSPEAQEAIRDNFNMLKEQDLERQRTAVGENVTIFPASDEMLFRQAQQMYTNQLMEAEKNRLEKLHQKDEQEVVKAATRAYGTTFMMDYIKNIPITKSFQRYKIAKGSMTGVFDNYIDKNIVGDIATGGVKRSGNLLSSAKNVAKEAVKQRAGEFADEYLDGLNSAFASGISNNEFDNYINRNYNPEAYYAATEGMLGNLLSGLSEFIEGTVDRENIYEGFIALTSGTSAIANANALFTPKDTWRAIRHGKDANGNELNIAERLSSVITNPILDLYTELKAKDRNINAAVDQINKIVEEKKSNLDDAAKLLTTLGDYSSPITKVRYTSDEDGMELPTLLDTRDMKLDNAFTLVQALKTLESVEGGTKSALYQDIMNNLEGLANNSLSDSELNDEIDRFLADQDNKSVLDLPNGREVAAERLQKNAKYLLDMKTKLDDIYSMFSQSTALKNVDPRVQGILAYNLAATDDYKKRLNTLETELGVSQTNADELYTPNLRAIYGTNKAVSTALDARERISNELGSQIDKLSEEIKDNKDKIESLKYQAKNSWGSKREKIDEEIKKLQTLNNFKQFELTSLQSRKGIADNEHKMLSSLSEESEPVFTEDDILSMDARDRAEILNPRNKGRYSKEQQKVIEHTLRNLLKKDPDALRKITDAGILASRVSDLGVVHEKITNNSDLASVYLSAVEQSRISNALAESLSAGIEEHYSKIEKAYENRFVKKTRIPERRQQEFKRAILNAGTPVIEAYIKDHPEQATKVQPYLDMLKFEEDAAAIINNNGSDPSNMLYQLMTLQHIEDRVNSRDEFISAIEDLIDSDHIDDDTKSALDNMLSTMKTMGYQRDATVVERRADRKRREEEAKRKLEEEKKKAEEAAQKAAEEAAKKVDVSPEDANIDTRWVNSDVDVSPEDANIKLNASDEEKRKLVEQSKSVEGIVKPSYFSSMENQLKDKNSKWSYYTEDDKNTRDTKDGVLILGTSLHSTLVPTINLAVDSGILDDKYRIPSDVKPSVEVSEKIRDAVKELQKLGIRTPKQTLDFIEEHEGKELDVVIEELNAAKEARKKQQESVIDNTVKEGHDDTIGDYVEVTSPSFGGLLKETPLNDGDSVDPDPGLDTSNENDVNNNTASPNLNGNPYGRYIIRPELNPDGKTWKFGGDGRGLATDKVLIPKRGEKPDDFLSKYFDWMESAGINLQNIIDDELPQILANDSHTKIKFMRVKPTPNATHDEIFGNTLFLVVDYDANVTNIHKESNGGVIETNGKKYLIVGVAYGNGGESFDNWKLLNDSNRKDGFRLPAKAWQWFENKRKAGTPERFYVDEDLYTEIDPTSMIPGFVVKQLVEDDSPKLRKISELINEDARNPHGLTLKNLSWGIREVSQYLRINTKGKKVMGPNNIEDNSGRVFVLIPAGNGKLLSAKIEPLRYDEDRFNKQGSLGKKVNNLLLKLTAPKTEDKVDAAMQLRDIFYLSNEGDNIWVSKDGKYVQFNKDGRALSRVYVDGNTSQSSMIDAFKQLNPRVNITYKVLSNEESLKEYDEAGALMTDLAKLGTSGVSYSVYPIGKDGKMVKPETPVSTHIQNGDSKDFAKRERQVYYGKGVLYSYNSDTDEFKLNGVKVEDQNTILGLRYAMRITDAKLKPAKSDKDNEYFILSSGEVPEVVKRSRKNATIEKLADDKAQAFIQDIEKEIEYRKKEEAAMDALDSLVLNSGEGMTITEEGDLGFTSNPEVIPSEFTPTEELELPGETESKELINPQVLPTATPSVSTYKATSPMVSFSTISKSSQKVDGIRVSKLIRDTIFGKWKNAPKKVEEMIKFLKAKNVEVDAIGTSDTDIKAWLDTITNCRD